MRQFFKILKYFFTGLVSIFLLLIILIQFPEVQRKIANVVKEKVLSENGLSEIEFERIKIGLTGKVSLYQLKVPGDSYGEILIVDKLKAKLSINSLLNRKVSIRNILLKGTKGKIFRYKNNTYNISGFLPKNEKDTTKLNTNKEGFGFEVGKVELEDIHFQYYDSLSQVFLDVNLGHFSTKMNGSNITELDFNFDKINLENTHVALGIGERLIPQNLKKSRVKSLLPIINAEALKCKNVSFRLNDLDKSSHLEAIANKIYSKNVLVDIGKELVEVDYLELLNSIYNMDYRADTIISAEPGLAQIDLNRKLSFSGGWTINANKVKGKNNKVNLQLKDLKDTLKVFNGTNFGFENISFLLEEISVQDEIINGKIKSVSGTDSNNFSLLDASVYFAIDENLGHFIIKKLKTQASNITAELDAKFPIQNPGLKELEIRQIVTEGNLSLEELAYFLPNLPGINEFPINTDLQVNIDIKGDSNNLQVKNLDFNSTDFFLLKSQGRINNYNSQTKINYNFSVDTIEFQNYSELSFIQSLNSLNINLPIIHSKLKFEGSSDTLTGNIVLNDGAGQVNIALEVLKDSLEYNYHTYLEANCLDFSKYIKDTLIRDFNGEFKVNGAFTDFNKRPSFSIMGENINTNIGGTYIDGLNLKGNYKDSIFLFETDHSSKELDFNARIEGSLTSDSINLAYQLKLDSLNTKYFNLTEEVINISTLLIGDIHYVDTGNFNITSEIENINLAYPGKNYNLDDIKVQYKTTNSVENVSLKTEGIDLRVQKNISLEEALVETRKFITRNINTEATYTPYTGLNFAIQCKVNNPLALQHFISNAFLDTLVVDSFQFNFNLHENKVGMGLSIPYLGFSGLTFGNIESNIKFNSNSFHSKITWENLTFKKLKTNRFALNFFNEGKELRSNLNFFDKNGELTTNIPAIMFQADSVLQFKLQSDSVLLGHRLWETEDDIAIQYDYKNNSWSSEGVAIKYKDQSIEFYEDSTEVLVELENLNLERTSHFFTISDTNFITKGRLSSTISITNIADTSVLVGIKAGLKDLHLMGVLYGDVALSFNEISEGVFKTTVEGTNNNDYINYTGNFGNTPQKQHTGSIYIADLSAYSVLLDTNIVNLEKGELRSEIDALINYTGLKLSGKLATKNAFIRMPQIGAQLRLVDEEFIFDESGIHFNKTIIEDLAGNKMEVNGEILTSNYKDYSFGLSINSDHFQVLNSLEKQDKNFFGKLVISTEVDLKGTNKEPILNANINVHEETDFTFILPGDDPLQTASEDIVKFSNSTVSVSDSLYITKSLSQVSDSLNQIINQGQLTVALTFSPLARYKVVTNSISGDYASFGLNGAFSYKSISNGLTELNGNIQFVNGLYSMSFYEMIKKEFTIEPQSVINFSGPLSNTTLDLKAKNIVRTNSLALMSSESIGNSQEEKALYNQRLPYELYFIVRGLLLSPEVSFALDLPNEYKQNSPMIASKLNKLASPEMEQERNMQVFALLATGGFIAENTGVTSGSGSSDVAATTARNTINSILSQQLNKMTSDNIKYFDMNLGLNTYEDYVRKGGNTTTDLDVQISKSMFDDKVNFEMESRINLDGSSNTNPNSSNYNTDYKLYYNLNENKTQRLKAYNLSVYDLFDGDITNTGVGIVFTKDFEGKNRKNYVETDSVQVND